MTENASSNTIELLTFQLSGQEYALDIMLVREIRGWTHATPLPHAPEYMEGVNNLRGTVLPVIDLSKRLGLSQPKQTDRNVVIVVKHGDAMTGLLVDAVSDIVAIPSADLQPPPDHSTASGAGLVSALTLLDERMIRILDLAATIDIRERTTA